MNRARIRALVIVAIGIASFTALLLATPVFAAPLCSTCGPTYQNCIAHCSNPASCQRCEDRVLTCERTCIPVTYNTAQECFSSCWAGDCVAVSNGWSCMY